MIPFFPSLRPPVANRVWFDEMPINEETEVLRHEREQKAWMESIKNAAWDLHPVGKILTMPGPETDDEDVCFLFAANDDSEDTDSHDDEDEDTNDRVINGQPERTALGLYSPGEIISLHEEIITEVN